MLLASFHSCIKNWNFFNLHQTLGVYKTFPFLLPLNGHNTGTEMVASHTQDSSNPKTARSSKTKRGMVLPFQPLSLAFDHVNYYVDTPKVNFYSLVTF